MSIVEGCKVVVKDRRHLVASSIRFVVLKRLPGVEEIFEESKGSCVGRMGHQEAAETTDLHDERVMSTLGV